jgi:hypothetical protein
MRKNLLILLLCAPLLYIAVSEGMRLYSVSTWSSPKLEAVDEEAPPKPEVLAKAKKTADAVVELSDGVTAAVVRLELPPPGTPLEPPLGNIVGAYAKKRAERGFEVEKAKEDGALVEKKITEILKKMRGPDGRPTRSDNELKALLGDYAEKVHDPQLLASARAEAAWPALEEDCPRSELDRQFDEIDRWSPSNSEQKTLSRTTFDNHAAKYRDYLKDHESAKGSSFAAKLAQEATERLELARRGAKLVEILNDSLKTATDGDLAKRQIDSIGAIVKLDDDSQPKRARSSLRHVLHSLGDDLLKPEPYDEGVFLRSANSPARQRVNRKDVQVTLKTGGEPVPLGPPGIDEYNLKGDQVENFTLKSTGELLNPPDAGVPPLQGTEYSDAIKAYNTARERVNEWSDLELGKLLDVCVKNQSKLDQGGGANQGGRTLIDRIKQLREIVRGHPSLFVPDVP